MHRLRVHCIALCFFACSQSEPGPVAPWVTALDPAQHDKFFPILAGPHALTCNTCHGTSETFRQFECIGCHTQEPTAALHRPGEGFSWESGSCYRCHGRGTAPFHLADHGPYFPVGPGQPHAVGSDASLAPGLIGCASCHAAGSTRIDCAGCHTQQNMISTAGRSFHASVPDLVPGPEVPGQCLLCHSGGAVPVSVTYSTRAPSHDGKYGFQVAPGGVHAGEPCLTCHSQTRTVSGNALPAADFTQQTCTACHSPKPSGSLDQDIDRVHLGLGLIDGFSYADISSPPLPADSRNCLNCHAHGVVDNFDHGAWFPVGRADTHAMGKSFPVPGSAAAVVTCAACHQDPAVRENVTCSSCHTPSGTNASGPAPIDLIPAHATLAGTNWQAPPGPTPQCVLCHAGDFIDRVGAHGVGSAAYPSDFPGVAFPIASGPHFAACEQCHTEQVTDANLRNPRIDFARRSCDACHSEAKDRVVSNHAGIGIHVADPSGPSNALSCLQCHPDGRAAPASVAYSHPYFPVDHAAPHPMGETVSRPGGAVTFSCASCHVSPSDFSQVDCTRCHSQASMTAPGGATAHSSVPDVPPSFAPGTETSVGLCLRCHADGKAPVSLTWSTAKVGTHDALFTFKVSAGSRHATTNPAERCSTCHSVTRPIAGTSRPIAKIDFTQQTCTACHAPAGALAQNVDQLHDGFGPITIGGVASTYRPLSSPPVPADSKSCLNCHADGSAGTLDHSRWFPIAGADTHALGSSFAVSGSPAAVTLACTTCHQDGAIRQSVTCTTCHTPSGTNASRTQAVDLVPAHATQLGGSNWLASGTPTPQCVLCHAGDFLERIGAHGTGSPGYPSDVPGVAFSVDSTSPAHFVACERCHPSQVAGDPDLRNPRTDFKVRTCNQCHAEAKDRLVTIHGLLGVTPAVSDTVDAGGSPFPGHARACLSCHPDGRAAPGAVAYSHDWFPVYTGSVHAMGAPAAHLQGAIRCASCHTALTSDPKRIDCTGCHTPAEMTAAGGAPFHAAVTDLTWPDPATPQETSLLCLRCHADSNVPAGIAYSTTSNKGRHDPSNAAIVFDVSAGAIHDTSRSPPPMACLSCHASTTAPFPESPELKVADFAQQSCTACHSLPGTLQQDLDAIHAGVTTPPPGYQPVPSPVTPLYSKTCLPCHPSGQVDPGLAARNHGGLFPIAALDSHAYGSLVLVNGQLLTTTCAICHLDPASRPNVDCTGCHIQEGSEPPGPGLPADQTWAHGGKVSTVPHNLWLGTGPVGTGQGASARCLLCHAADARPAGFTAIHGQAGPASAIFPIDAQSGGHFASCDQCHTAARVDPRRLDAELDFAQASCDACHLPGGPESIVAAHQAFGSPITAPYAASDPDNWRACLGCHPGGGTSGNFPHPSFPIAADAVHGPAVARCGDCHSNQASYKGDPTANLPLISCTRCHNDAPGNEIYQNGWTITEVHTEPVVGRDIWDVPGRYDYSNGLLCLTCHAGNIGGDVSAMSTPLVFRLADHDLYCRMSDKPIARGNSPHRVDSNANNGVNICFACHDARQTSGSTPWARDWAVASPTTSCIACHQSPPAPTRCQ